MSKLNLHAFLIDWPKIHENIADLKDIVTTNVENVTILDNPDHYFSEQWNEMLGKFSGDTLLWIMGDVTAPPKFWQMRQEMDQFFERHPDVGVYGPNVDYTFHTWDVETFNAVEPMVYEVPCAEPNFWVIRKEVLNKLQPVDISKNRFGWGVDLMVSAVAELSGFKVVRDYRYTAGHPRFTGYNEAEAEKQMAEWKATLSPELGACMQRRWDNGLQYNINWKRRNETKRV